MKYNKVSQIKELLEEVIAYSPDAIVIIPEKKHIMLSNPPLETMFGYTKEELSGKPMESLLSERFKSKYCAEMDRVFQNKDLKKNTEVLQEWWGMRKNGKQFPLNIFLNKLTIADKAFLVCSVQDITEKKRTQKTIDKLKNYDLITNLPNRLRFSKILNKRIANSSKEKTHFALLLININRLKFINDYYGHHVGDMLLKKTAARISTQIRSNDFLARLESDEFALIMDADAPHQPGILAKRLLEAFESPIQVLDNTINLSLAIGITIFPNGGDNEITLLKNADIALYRAKSLRTFQFAYFSTELNAQYSSRLFIEHNLALAIKNQEFALAYQPQVNLLTGQITGMEALLRWNNPETGLISPDVFIPIAENEGFIGTLGIWVFKEVCKQLKCWKTLNIPVERISLNLSINQLNEPHLASTFHEICKRYQINPTQIDLEITETSIMSLESEALNTLHELNGVGFSLSIDDFGAGYSSLSRLNKIPVKTLKIDKSLIQDTGANATKILLAIIHLANNMELEVIAEGVDTQQKCTLLAEAGCKTGQGYYFYHPMNVEKMSQLLQKQQKKSGKGHEKK